MEEEECDDSGEEADCAVEMNKFKNKTRREWIRIRMAVRELEQHMSIKRVAWRSDSTYASSSRSRGVHSDISMFTNWELLYVVELEWTGQDWTGLMRM